MLKVQPDPTFTAPVEIPTHLGVETIKMEFKFRTEDELKEWSDANADKPDRPNADVIMEAAVNWSEVDRPFDRENIETVCKNYPHAAVRILETYFKELRKDDRRLGN